MQNDLGEELRRAEEDFACGEFIELTHSRGHSSPMGAQRLSAAK
jgi:hypothetical protein